MYGQIIPIIIEKKYLCKNNFWKNSPKTKAANSLAENSDNNIDP
jgi:hypothetical protein